MSVYESEYGYRIGIAGDRRLPRQPYVPFTPVIIPDVVHVPATGDSYDTSVVADEHQSGLRSLREMSAIVVASAVDAVQTLDGVPWHLGKLILSHLKTQNANRRYWKLFADSYPDRIGVHERHLSFKCLKASARDPATLSIILQSPAFNECKNNLNILDLSGTMFGNENMDINAIAAISLLSNLRMLDLSRTPLTFDVLRALARPARSSPIKAEGCNSVFVATRGLASLTHLNIFACSMLICQNSLQLIETLSSFPSLVVAEIGSTGALRSWIKNNPSIRDLQGWIGHGGWLRIPSQINLFPGLRGNTDCDYWDALERPTRFVTSADAGQQSNDKLVAELTPATSIVSSGQEISSLSFYQTSRSTSVSNVTEQSETNYTPHDDRRKNHAFCLDDKTTMAKLSKLFAGHVTDGNDHSILSAIDSGRKLTLHPTTALPLSPRNNLFDIIEASLDAPLSKSEHRRSVIQREWWWGPTGFEVMRSRAGKGNNPYNELLRRDVGDNECPETHSEMTVSVEKALLIEQNARFGLVRVASAAQTALRERWSTQVEAKQKSDLAEQSRLDQMKRLLRSKSFSVQEEVMQVKKRAVVVPSGPIVYSNNYTHYSPSTPNTRARDDDRLSLQPAASRAVTSSTKKRTGLLLLRQAMHTNATLTKKPHLTTPFKK